MFKQPEEFIQEKLSKKELSANTVRDLILAALLVALKKNEIMSTECPLSKNWLELKAIEIREKASRVFASIEAPFEYPTILQLEQASDRLKKAYSIEKLSSEIQFEFDQNYGLILSKFCKPF